MNNEKYVHTQPLTDKTVRLDEQYLIAVTKGGIAYLTDNLGAVCIVCTYDTSFIVCEDRDYPKNVLTAFKMFALRDKIRV